MLCLNMIVRNEMANLERCLSAVADHIDCWVIGDTGSTDGTQDFIKSFFAARNLPGELHSFPFRNFEQARNAALDCAYASPLGYDYLLFADADMELVVEDAGFRERLEAPGYRLLQRSDALTYWNTRIVRRDAGARYHGVTHEYLEVPGEVKELKGVWYKDHASGSNRVEKFERDIKLLLEGLKREPENHRYWFYLAQSYRDAGKTAKAAKAYAKRAEMGGWDEEAWNARLQEARCLRTLGDEGAFVRQAIAAFNQRPQRAEPLYDLARFYRERGMNHASVLFSEAGLALPRPQEDILFLENFIYTAGLQEEYSIAANYARDPARKVRGFAACNWLALNREIPDGPRGLARANLVYYVQPASAMMPSFATHPVGFTPPDGYRPMNPSITRLGEQIVLAQRTVNYTLTDDNRYEKPDGVPFQTRNFLLRLDDKLNIQTSVEILPPADLLKPAYGEDTGFQDLRLFAWRGELWCVATFRELTPEGWHEQVLARIDDRGPGPCRLTDWRVLQPEGPRRHEKNWMPRVDGEKLQFIYLCDPTRVLDEQARTIVENTPAITAEQFRGGSQAIAFDGGWLTLIHEVLWWPSVGRRSYQHRFVWFDETSKLRGVSRPFFLQKKGVEFAAGLAWHPDENRLLVSYGVGDAEAWIATVEVEDVRRVLEDVERLPSGAPTTGGHTQQRQMPWHYSSARTGGAERSGNTSMRATDINNDPISAGAGDRPLVPRCRPTHGGKPEVSWLAAEAHWATEQTNRALRNNRAVEYARAATLRIGVPLHPDPPKAWDNFLALYHTVANTEPDSPVLDAGGARYSAYLPALHALGYTNLIGINLLEREAETVNGIQYRYGDITKTDFSNGYFGFVACLSVIEHGVDWRLFLQEMVRILRPGGQLFVSMDYWEGPIDVGDRIEFGVPVKIFTPAEVMEFIGYASNLGLTLAANSDLTCEQKVINWLGLNYTFCNLLFRKDSGSRLRAPEKEDGTAPGVLVADASCASVAPETEQKQTERGAETTTATPTERHELPVGRSGYSAATSTEETFLNLAPFLRAADSPADRRRLSREFDARIAPFLSSVGGAALPQIHCFYEVLSDNARHDGLIAATASMRAAGHPVRVWSYSPQKLEFLLPGGIEVRAADDVMPRGLFEQIVAGSEIRYFSDIFRYAVLYEHGGLWMDSDVVLLRPFPFRGDHFFNMQWRSGIRNEHFVCGNVMYAEPYSRHLRNLYEMSIDRFSAARGWVFGDVGPKLLSDYIASDAGAELRDWLFSPVFFNPIDWTEVDRFKQPLAELADYLNDERVFGIHLWTARNDPRRGEDASLISMLSDPLGSFPSFTSLADRYNTDKNRLTGNRHCYARVYDGLLGAQRFALRRLMEIGLCRGLAEKNQSDTPSVALWQSYFPFCHVVGVDLTDFSRLNNERFSSFVCDQSKRDQLRAVAAKLEPGSFDVIIDDGSHASADEQLTLVEFFPLLADGGWYFIEDLDWQPSGEDRATIALTKTLLREIQEHGAARSLDPLGVGALAAQFAEILFFDSHYELNRARLMGGLVAIRKRAGSGLVR